jgi:hypothetical protein
MATPEASSQGQPMESDAAPVSGVAVVWAYAWA